MSGTFACVAAAAVYCRKQGCRQQLPLGKHAFRAPTHPLQLVAASLPCRDGLHRLTQIIFSKAQPKRLGSQILSGPMLAGLTEAYVNAINNGCDLQAGGTGAEEGEKLGAKELVQQGSVKQP